MEDGYIVNTLCSTPPSIYLNGRVWYNTYHVIQYDNNRVAMPVIKLNDNSTIQKNFEFVCNLVINNYKQQYIKFHRDKETFCLYILAKIRYITHIFQKYNNYLGKTLLKDSLKVQRYYSYSESIVDYTECYTYEELYRILYNTNKIISQNIACIKQNHLYTFKMILHMLLNQDINDILKEKIHFTIINDEILLKIFNVYIKNMNYYIKIGELFKNV